MKKYIVMRHPVLPEDEGRAHYVAYFDTLELAREWIKNQEGEYFGPATYFIIAPLDAISPVNS